MNTAKKFTGFDIITVGFIVACCVHPAQAGWVGAMNGIGYGQASVNVRAFDTSAIKARNVVTTNMVSPSAAIKTTEGYVFGAPLPTDASPATVAKVKGSPGYIWQATTIGSDGDSTDEPELESRITIHASDCAALEMETAAIIDETNKSGTITVNVIGTAGTAIWLRGFELLGGQVPPEDDPNTTTNEFIEFLKANGSLKWDVLNVGPLNQNTNDCSALKIPFSYETHITNLYSVSQGVAKSLPLVVECPSDIVVDCQQPVTYPETVLVGGCGNITISFDPPPLTNSSGMTVPFPPGTFPVGPNLVTVTATDKDGNSTNCTFNVVVTDTTPPAITAIGTPVNGVLGFNPTSAEIEAALGTATATDNCGVGNPTAETGSVSVNGCSRSQTRTWNVADAAGNPATPVSRTVTWTVDTTPPAVSLAAFTIPCNYTAIVKVPVPTSGSGNVITDNCGGAVTVTPNQPQVYSGTGVTWTFTDAAGNATNVVQAVVSTITFKGFYSPIGTVSNSCTPPSVVAKNQGSVIPIKFDMFCGTTKITGGTPPTVTIQPVASNCALTGTPVTVNAVYQNDWHYNWDTTGWAKATYKVTVNLPGGAKPYVFIKVK